ncbi:glycosyltransferase [Brachybacterium hainanense]|uniref:Glycosyltransferase n=1 Tax=Brachybacterium hainanense TaxID=1541174 RepID=A0ABV6RCH0_9MICO
MVLRASAGTARRTALWLIPVPELGGVARHALDATAAGIPGWRVIVLCPEGPLAEALRDQDTPVLTGPVSPADGTRCATAHVRGVLRRLRPDVLHTHLAFADLTGVAAATGLRSGRGRRIRVVSTEHGIAGVRGYYQAGRPQAAAKAAAHRARLHRTDAVIAVSESTREQIHAQWGHAAPVTVIRNEVQVPAGVPQPRPGLRILSLARLAPEKRIDELLRAFALVLAEHPQARLTIAGTGPCEAELRAVAAELGLAEAVTFPGHVDAAAALAEHDVVVQLSVWENLSYTLLDAVAYGLGVVATDVGGNAEIVPARCLVVAEDHRGVAAMVLEQGLEPARRPVRPPESGGDHGLARMTAQIDRTYAEAVA